MRTTATRSSTRSSTTRSAIALLVGVLVGAASARLDADIEGTTFSSKADNVRVTLPRGWRWSDQATYPGILLRLNRTRPRATILLAVDPVPETIDAACRQRAAAVDGVAASEAPRELQIACQQAKRLAALGFTVGAIKEAARPWFDYSGEGHELRQGVAVLGDRVFTLVLAATTTATRAQYARTFDRTLRSVRELEATEAPAGTSPTATDAGTAPVATDAGVP